MKLFTSKQLKNMNDIINNIDYLIHSYPSENSFNDLVAFSEVENQIKTLKFILEGHKFKYDKN